MKLTRWDLIEIIWVDSHMIHGWTKIEEADLDEERSLEHRSVGYFLHQTRRQITICQSSKTDEDFIKEEETNVCGVFTIPKIAIEATHRLSQQDTRKSQKPSKSNQKNARSK